MVASLLHELVTPPPAHTPPLFFDPHSQHWPTRLITAWDDVCRRVLAGESVEELHASRDDYHAVLVGHLKMLEGYLVVLDRFRTNVPGNRFAVELQQQLPRLRRHLDSLFPRWQTQDDLEAILLERISTPNSQLKELAAENPPPQSWYDEAGESP